MNAESPNAKPPPRNAHRADHKILESAQLKAVADLFAVLSEESRLCILQILKDGPIHVGELVERSGMKQANVSKQLGILLSAGIIGRKQDGNRAIYSITLPLVFDLCELVCGGMAKQAQDRATALNGLSRVIAAETQ